MTSDPISAIRLIRSEGVGPRSYYNLAEKHGSPKNAVAVLEEIGRQVYSLQAAEAELESVKKAGAKILIHGEEDYPAPLANIYDPPPVLFCLGNIELLKMKSVGIVGTRNASANGLSLARNFAADLAKNGIVVISGLARGIDTEVHKASLKGTIAVVAGGLDKVYPPENFKLFHDIAAEGLIVSENPFGVTAQARHFPQRNRIIAGLSDGVLVVEAARKSGSMITAAFAHREGRPVFAVPGSPLDPRSAGTNYLLRNGGVFTETAEDILKNLRPVEKLPKLCEEELEYLGETLEASPETLRDRIISKLSHSPTSVDEVIQQSGANAAVVNEILLELEMKGQITRQYGNKVALAA